ncbi:PREDICTED: guanine deaminase-like [Branchiostoma belcheri]|uniref:Guanine deaminase n=1 Tax=Branchiostoma belcheri TaxID=7741 RepID=A0A6P4YMQ9_BRABE|nr:PREDICTED: guanine deaminase-like [Branchiostoma belcheri]
MEDCNGNDVYPGYVQNGFGPGHESEGVKVFRGTLVHSTKDKPMQILKNGVIGVDPSGKILFVKDDDSLEDLAAEIGFNPSVHNLTDSQFIIPGFIDTHIHAPQYPNTGTKVDLPLLEWLHAYTFPLETKYSDLDFARDVYKKVVHKTLSCGTTTASYFATIHKKASMALCDAAEYFGQRAYVGKCNSDQNVPDHYCEGTDASLKNTEEFIKEVLGRKNPLITPVITPRYAVACTTELMSGLGKLAQKYDLPIQSHLCESPAEVTLVSELFPQYDCYTDVYDKCGVFTNKTVMAHCVYLTEFDLDLMRERGVGVSHCPNSNLSICSGMMDARTWLDRGLKVGLGTDVSGGYHPSMLDAIRLAIHTSNAISIQRPADYRPISYQEAFRMATLGGAEALALDDTIGNFEEGKDFDALLIDMDSSSSRVDTFDFDSIEDLVQKFLFIGDDRNIQEVYVCGQKVMEHGK